MHACVCACVRTVYAIQLVSGLRLHLSVDILYTSVPFLTPRYCWLFYINPNFYGFSASAFILLENFQPNCDQSELECYVQSGEYILRQFSFDQINPFLNLAVSSVHFALAGLTDQCEMLM